MPTGPVPHQNRLLAGAFRRRKAHRRTRHRLTDRCRIRRVVLVGLDQGTERTEAGSAGPHGPALPFTRPSSAQSGAGVHADKTGRQSGEERPHLPAAQLPPQYRAPLTISTVNLEHRLCRIKPDRRNIHRGRSLCLEFKTKLHSGATDAVIGGIHTIRLTGASHSLASSDPSSGRHARALPQARALPSVERYGSKLFVHGSFEAMTLVIESVVGRRMDVAEWMLRKRCAEPGDLNLCCLRSRRRTG